MITRKCDLERIFLNEQVFTFFAYSINFDIQFCANIYKIYLRYIHINFMRENFIIFEFQKQNFTKKKKNRLLSGKQKMVDEFFDFPFINFPKNISRDIFLHFNFNRSTCMRTQRICSTFHHTTNRPMVSFHLSIY